MCFQETGFNDSLIHVSFSAALRCRKAGGTCCKRWYFTFTGTECSQPATIEGIVYNYDSWLKGAHSNDHRVRHIAGYCENLPPGHITVAVNVGNCLKEGGGETFSGWQSVSRIAIEEVPPPQR